MSRAARVIDPLEGELTSEPVMGPAMGSAALHAGLAAALVLYGILGGFFHHNLWGNSGSGGAIQVQLVSNALPLPSDQPQNKNVLATETPSTAPAPPAPKTKVAVDETAIPIPGKEKKKQHEIEHQTPQRKVEQPQSNLAYYGEQSGSSMPRATQAQTFTNGQTSVSDASFGSLFSWYVGQIDRKMDASGNRLLAPGTPKGAKAYIEFRIYRDGTVGDVMLEQSSGSAPWDSACVGAGKRASNFGPLPSGYRDTFLQVYYYCEY